MPPTPVATITVRLTLRAIAHLLSIQEILFGPLTGIEVLSTRIDSSVVVIECTFSINLTALTLEQVIAS
jgi:hypothetical protein